MPMQFLVLSLHLLDLLNQHGLLGAYIAYDIDSSPKGSAHS